jgi:hypothetical protein
MVGVGGRFYGPGMAARPLTDRERAILDFEARAFQYAGYKEQAIRDTFDLTATRYYQLVNALIEEPAAIAYQPVVVKRLQRLRETRVAKRSARRFGAAKVR